MTHSTVNDSPNPIIVLLTPAQPRVENELLASRIQRGFTLIHGYATDADGQPMADVQVSLQKAGVRTTTDKRGYYWFSVPTPARTAPGGTDTLIANKPGYKTIIHRNILVGGEDAGGYFLGMVAGSVVDDHDDTHKLLRPYIEPQTPAPRQR